MNPNDDETSIVPIDSRFTTGWYEDGDESYAPDFTDQEIRTLAWVAKNAKFKEDATRGLIHVAETAKESASEFERMLKSLVGAVSNEKAREEKAKSDHKRLERTFSRVYGNPENGNSKRFQYKDYNAGKVRGR